MMNEKSMRKEAIERMKMLKLHPNVIEDFKIGIINKSETRLGFLYWLSNDEMDMIHEWEEEHNCLVYHVILSKTEFGILMDFLYVGSDDNEWEYKREDIECNTVFSYCKNLTCEWCSEFGSIGIASVNGGLVRTA